MWKYCYRQKVEPVYFFVLRYEPINHISVSSSPAFLPSVSRSLWPPAAQCGLWVQAGPVSRSDSAGLPAGLLCLQRLEFPQLCHRGGCGATQVWHPHAKMAFHMVYNFSYKLLCASSGSWTLMVIFKYVLVVYIQDLNQNESSAGTSH